MYWLCSVKLRLHVNSSKIGCQFFAPKIGYWSQKQPVLPPTLWAQNSDAIQQLLPYKKSHQNNIISATKHSFKPFLQKNGILKFSNKTMIDNVLFITKALDNILPPMLLIISLLNFAHSLWIHDWVLYN